MNSTPKTPSRRPAVRPVPFGLAPFDDFGRVLGRFFGDLPARGSSFFDLGTEVEGQGFRPSVELSETEGGLRLVAELPGLAEDDIDLRVEDGHLILSGEKRTEEQSERDGVVHTERRFGSFRRTLPLPFEIDFERTEATFENGVLTVELLRTEQAEPQRRIQIRKRD